MLEEEMSVINVWELWDKEFYNAKKFFDSKGNIQTRSKLKDKWCEEFFETLELIKG